MTVLIWMMSNFWKTYLQFVSLRLISIADPAKKRSSNFLCSIICCLGKRSSKHKNKDKEVSANANTGDVIDSGNAKPSKAPQKALLPDLRPEEADKKCIVIDLDETLVHSSFKVRSKKNVS